MVSLVNLIASHDRPDHSGHFFGHGHTRNTRGLSGKEREKVGIGCFGLVLGPADQRCRADHQEFPQIPIPHLGNATEAIFATTRVGS